MWIQVGDAAIDTDWVVGVCVREKVLHNPMSAFPQKDGWQLVIHFQGAPVWMDCPTRLDAKKTMRNILETFIGPCPEGMECCHKDNDRGKNVLSNLQWGTKQENQQQRREFGTAPIGENHGEAKLTDEKVREMRQLHAEGWIITRLAERFGVSRRVVGRVVKREAWCHVG